VEHEVKYIDFETHRKIPENKNGGGGLALSRGFVGPGKKNLRLKYALVILLNKSESHTSCSDIRGDSQFY